MGRLAGGPIAWDREPGAAGEFGQRTFALQIDDDLDPQLARIQLLAQHAVIGLVNPVATESFSDGDDLAQKRRDDFERSVGCLTPLRFGQRQEAVKNRSRERIPAGGHSDITAGVEYRRADVAIRHLRRGIWNGSSERAALLVDMGQNELRLRHCGVPRPHDLLDGTRQQYIVRVEKHHDATVTRAKSGVECGCVPAVWLEDRGYSVAVSGNHLAGVVGRTVIDDYDFGGRIGLFDSTIDGRAQETTVVEVIDDNADQRLQVAL